MDTLRPSRGSITLDNQNLLRRSPPAIARLGVARTFQSVEHYKQFTVLEYVTLGRVRHFSQSVIAHGLGLPFAVHSERRQSAIAREYVARYGLEDVRDARLTELPYGFQKSADIVRAIALEPSVILLDEPASGSNQNERRVLRSIIHGLKEEKCGVVLVDHDISFVSDTCDRMLAMDAGEMLTVGQPADVLSNQAVIESYIGRQ
jgi:branched-chain amino acid transport system ATP-binding protein